MTITVAGNKKDVAEGLTVAQLVIDENVETPQYVTVTIDVYKRQPSAFSPPVTSFITALITGTILSVSATFFCKALFALNSSRAVYTRQVWCGKRDLNPYVKATRPSNVPVCQFQHLSLIHIYPNVILTTRILSDHHRTCCNNRTVSTLPIRRCV